MRARQFCPSTVSAANGGLVLLRGEGRPTRRAKCNSECHPRPDVAKGRPKSGPEGDTQANTSTDGRSALRVSLRRTWLHQATPRQALPESTVGRFFDSYAHGIAIQITPVRLTL